MNEQTRDAILRAHYRSKDRYEKLAQEIARLFDADIDPAVPSESIYTIKYRIKGEERLLEKLSDKEGSFSETSYIDAIDDILGMRIVCLRLSDVTQVETFLTSLKKERKLIFTRNLSARRPFSSQLTLETAGERRLTFSILVTPPFTSSSSLSSVPARGVRALRARRGFAAPR